MTAWFGEGWGNTSFAPHGYCLLWRPDLIALHAVSDALIALSYFAIPLVMAWFLRKRPDIAGEHKHVAWLFVAFITACGLTHAIGLVTLWSPIYEIQGVMKAATAAVSLTTVGALVLIIPNALKIPSVQQLEAANAELRAVKDELARSADDRARALAVTSQRLEAAILGAPIVIAAQDRTLTYSWVSHQSMGHGPGWFIGKSDYEIMPSDIRDTVIGAKLDVLAHEEPRSFEVDVREEGAEKTYDVRVQPARSPEGRVEGVITVAIDVTERKRREEQIKLSMREMAHRVKNIFAVIQAITRQTATHSTTRDEFLDRFNARLTALASSHELLLGESTGGVSMAELVRSQLGHFGDLFGRQIVTQGPDVVLPTEHAQAVGLALHELATNAVKYGALSQPTGVVNVSWSLAGDVATLRWEEAGGPPVAKPDRHGFGRSVVERMVARAVGGEADLTFAPDGLTWRLSFPLRTSGREPPSERAGAANAA